MHYLRTDDLVTEIHARIHRTKKQIRAAYYDVHIHPKTVKNPAYSIFRAMIDAHARGVTVRLLVPCWNYNKANRRTAFYLDGAGLYVRQMPREKPLHTKMMIFDETALVLGSHNLSRPGLTKNLETSAVLTAPEDLRAAVRDFEGWWRASRTIEE
jgi:phosphatidylserine/phosphatidylglycerophosphate/cardiolipin synthase-like enzyme